MLDCPGILRADKSRYKNPWDGGHSRGAVTGIQEGYINPLPLIVV